FGDSWQLPVFDDSAWLSGTTGVGYENGSGYQALIGLDVKADMLGINQSAYVRVPFDVAADAVYNSLTLRMKYDDGFAAYLNGVPVASRYADASPQWNAGATANHGDNLAIIYEDIDISAFTGGLQAGENILAIHGLNFGLGSSDFLLIPELAATEVTWQPDQLLYFTEPTPGWANLGGIEGFVADTVFDHDRDFYTDPFDLAITSETVGAEIRYTLDGSEPTETHGAVYAGPIHIAGTTVLRAAAFKAGLEASNVDTHTYLFLADVIGQSPDNQLPEQNRLVDGTFDSDAQGFVYADDVFNGTADPDGADGAHSGGALEVSLGPGPVAAGLSGGWSSTFSVEEQGLHGLSVRYRMVLGPDFEASEFGELILEIDGNRYGTQANSSLIHVAGDGAGGGTYDSGWQRADFNATLSAGVHTLTVGAYANGAPLATDYLDAAFDDVIVSEWPATSVNGQIIDYGMDPDIVNSPTWGPQMLDALTDIPSMSIVIDIDSLFDPSTGIYSNPGGHGELWERQGSLELIIPDDFPAEADPDGFQVEMGLRIRGGFSRSTGNPKHALRLFFRGEYGDAKLNYPLFGDEGADSFDKFDLRTSQNYSWSFQGSNANTMNREVFSRDAQADMGQPYTRTRYYHLYINGQYWGIYETQERSEAAYAETYFGGDKDEYDTVKCTGSSGGYTTEATDGTLDAWQALWTIAKNEDFSDDTIYYKVQGLGATGVRDPALPVYLDMDNLIDYMVVILYGGNLDAPISNFLGNNRPNNWYATRNQNGEEPFYFYAHDAEHTLLNVNQNRNGPWPAGDEFRYGNPQWIHQELMENPEYCLLFADRVHDYFFNNGLLSPDANVDRFMSRADEIDMAIIAESARWGDAKRATPYTKSTWEGAVSNITNNYMPARSDVVVQQFRNTVLRDGSPAPLYPGIVAPTFNQHGGSITPGFGLTMTAPAGTIYYTLDGTDPRAWGGGIAPGAMEYTGAVILDESTQARARVWDGAGWSALNQAVFLDNVPIPLRVTELMYHPADPGLASPYTELDFEFIEVRNVGAEALDVGSFRFDRGIDFTFPDLVLAAGEYVLVARNQAAFGTVYDTTGMTIAGEYTGMLDNGGETIGLVGRFGEPVQEFKYEDGWYDETDGEGFSLSIADDTAGLEAWGKKWGWRPSWYGGGSPGEGDTGLDVGAVVINEVLTHTDLGPGDWIEVHNTTGQDIPIGGWYFSDSDDDLTKYEIAAGTVLHAGEYLGFTQFATFGVAGNPGVNDPFSMSELGDDLYLTAVEAGNLLGYREHVDFEASDRELTFGRHTVSTGDVDFVTLSAPTFEAANAYPEVGPLVLNEIMYHPPDGDIEYIEIHNISGAAVPLFDPANPANVW
ncbi:lamin tail domain-containing protein, partial [bacterium]|nr:lamin tail domain-containing protein [bacterium]